MLTEDEALDRIRRSAHRGYSLGSYSPSDADLPVFDELARRGVLHKSPNCHGPGGIFRFPVQR